MKFLLVFCLAGLACFILWEAWQRRRPAPLRRAEMVNGFTPGAANREVAWFTLAGTLGAFGVALFVEPPQPPFSGRGARLLELLHAQLGARAYPVLVWVIATGALVQGISARRGRRPGKRRV